MRVGSAGVLRQVGLRQLHMAAAGLVSQRGAAAPLMLPTYLADARGVERYDPVECPHGVLQLSVAENQMLTDLLVPKIKEIAASARGDDLSPGLFAADMIYYQQTHGMPECREAVCSHLSRVIAKGEYEFDPDKVIIGAGCNAVLENLCFTIGDRGEGVMIPRPYYAAFEFDLQARADMVILPVDVKRSGFEASSYYPSAESLEACYQASLERGVTPRALLLSSPNNPLGICYPAEVLSEILQWCESKEDYHLISDEIYAGSVYREESHGQPGWTSIAAIAGREGRTLGDRVHIVWAMSKDFALSGLRVGALYTENEAIRVPMQKLNDLCQVGSTTQATVGRLLGDALEPDALVTDNSAEAPPRYWAVNMQRQNSARLRERYDQLTGLLEQVGIPYLPGGAGLFLWLDLRAWLDVDGADALDAVASTSELSMLEEASLPPREAAAERALYLRLIHEYGLLLTPGASMRTEGAGFFRCVFSAASDEAFAAALGRFEKLGLSSRR